MWFCSIYLFQHMYKQSVVRNAHCCIFLERIRLSLSAVWYWSANRVMRLLRETVTPCIRVGEWRGLIHQTWVMSLNRQEMETTGLSPLLWCFGHDSVEIYGTVSSLSVERTNAIFLDWLQRHNKSDIWVLASRVNRTIHSSIRGDNDNDKVLISYPTFMLNMCGYVWCTRWCMSQVETSAWRLRHCRTLCSQAACFYARFRLACGMES